MGMNVPFVNFAGGEIGKEALARVDLDVYPACAETMENVFPLMQGPMIKAPGSEYIGRTQGDAVAIVRPFIFSVDQTRVLEISDSRIDIVDGNAYVDVDGAAATIGTPANNGSTAGSSVLVSGQNVTFTAAASGEAAAYWPITGGEANTPVTFLFEILRRPLNIRIGTTNVAADIELPGPDGTYELTLDPGTHIITFTPPGTSYYIRARLQQQGKAALSGLRRVAAGGFYIPAPWLAADLPQLRYRQSLDTFWLYHPNYRTRVLERRSNTSWSLRFLRPLDGPFDAPNTSTTTLAPTAYTGNAIINASASVFAADCVGQLIEMTHQGQTVTETFSGASQQTESIRIFGIETARVFTLSISGTFTATIALQRSVNEVDWTTVSTYTSATTTSIDDGFDNQTLYYRLACTAYTSGSPAVSLTYAAGETTGRAEIIVYNSATQVEVEISPADNFGKLDATANWSLGAWSNSYGWPAAGTIDNGCHCLIRDDRFWKSVSDDYESFLLGTDPADAMARRFGTGEMNSGLWIEGGKRLLIGTNGAELEVTSNALDEPITATNSRLRGFDDNGSADTQAMKATANRVLFVDRTRAKLLQALYDTESASDQHDTDDLTRLHNEIAGIIDEESGGGFVEIAFQRRPEPRAYCVREDGEMAVLLFGPREGTYAWARYKAAPTSGGEGLIKSVCVVPGRPEDRVHILVQRVIDGQTRMFHERLALQRFPVVETTDEDGLVVRTAPAAWRLQAALYSTGEATDTFSGLDHLEGETVRIWADGRAHASRTVEGGSITLDGDYETVIIGLNYVGYWKSAKLAYGAQMGTALTMDKSVIRLGAVLHDTPLGAVKYGRDWDNATEMFRREDSSGSFLMDVATPFHSEEHNQPFEGASEIDPRICIVMDEPAPVMVQALIPQVELHERS